MSELKKILVVDDDDDIRMVIKLILDGEGYEISELNNGREVDQFIKQLRPDLILLDVMLGDMDGRDICKTLKTDQMTAGIPIIIVSATHGLDSAHEKICMANDYLDKPFDIADLISKVRYYSAA